MENYFYCLKKEESNAKKEINMDTEDADPTCQLLHAFFCHWVVNKNVMLVWVYTVMVWNCMTRSCNIEQLNFQCMKKGARESVCWKYENPKTDQQG